MCLLGGLSVLHFPCLGLGVAGDASGVSPTTLSLPLFLWGAFGV